MPEGAYRRVDLIELFVVEPQLFNRFRESGVCRNFRDVVEGQIESNEGSGKASEIRQPSLAPVDYHGGVVCIVLIHGF